MKTAPAWSASAQVDLSQGDDKQLSLDVVKANVFAGANNTGTFELDLKPVSFGFGKRF